MVRQDPVGSYLWNHPLQGEDPNYDNEYVETSTTNRGRGMENEQENGNDVVSQAILKVIEQVFGAQGGSGNRATIIERLQSNRAKKFKRVSDITPTTAKYWLYSTKRILEDLECTPEQKLKGIMSLIREEAYHWQKVVEGVRKLSASRGEYFLEVFQNKYVGSRYVEARRREFLELQQGDKSMVGYEVELLRLSCYA